MPLSLHPMDKKVFCFFTMMEQVHNLLTWITYFQWVVLSESLSFNLGPKLYNYNIYLTNVWGLNNVFEINWFCTLFMSCLEIVDFNVSKLDGVAESLPANIPSVTCQICEWEWWLLILFFKVLTQWSRSNCDFFPYEWQWLLQHQGLWYYAATWYLTVWIYCIDLT